MWRSGMILGSKFAQRMKLPMGIQPRMSGWRTLLIVVALTLPLATTGHAQFSIVEALGNAFGQTTSFDQCPQFFVNGTPPKVPNWLKSK